MYDLKSVLLQTYLRLSLALRETNKEYRFSHRLKQPPYDNDT